jgi:hypothetical protein
MEVLKLLLPLVGVLLGASITGISGAFKLRTERKKNIASLVSELLCIRHEMYGVTIIAEELIKVINVPGFSVFEVQKKIEALIPENAELNKRYDNALNQLSAFDPVLAFELRSKNEMPAMLRKMRDMIPDSEQNQNSLIQLNRFFAIPLIEDLESTILELSEKHSKELHVRIKEIIENSNSKLRERFLTMIKNLEEKLRSSEI